METAVAQAILLVTGLCLTGGSSDHLWALAGSEALACAVCEMVQSKAVREGMDDAMFKRKAGPREHIFK